MKAILNCSRFPSDSMIKPLMLLSAHSMFILTPTGIPPEPSRSQPSGGGDPLEDSHFEFLKEHVFQLSRTSDISGVSTASIVSVLSSSRFEE